MFQCSICVEIGRDQQRGRDIEVEIIAAAERTADHRSDAVGADHPKWLAARREPDDTIVFPERCCHLDPCKVGCPGCTSRRRYRSAPGLLAWTCGTLDSMSSIEVD